MTTEEAENVPPTRDPSPSKKPEKPEKPPIDNATLASMLRESADLVEKGEFEVILYHALQDFRTYYKQHLPKKKDKDKKKKTKIISTTTTHIPADPEKEAKAEAETPVKRPEPEPTKVEPVAPAAKPDPSSTTSVATDDAVAAPVEPMRHKDPALDVSDHPIAKESARFDSSTSQLDSNRSVDEFNNEASLRQHPESHLSPHGAAEKPSSSSKLAASMFGKKMKLPKKMPKIHVQLPNSGKKKGKPDLSELTGGEVAQQAESSKRRNAPVDTDWGNDAHQINKNVKLQPAVTGMADDPVTTSTPEIPVDRATGNSPPSSEPANEDASEPASHKNNAEPAPQPVHTAAFPSSLSDSFVADPIPGDSNSVDIPTMDNHRTQHSKLAFQQPKNKSSSLVANGWIEQQRRSKMRTVWKEVLASLVEGRRPGEETTLWIQREVVDPATGKKELEALHQIPVKLLEAVIYSEYTTDDRFSLRLFRAQEEFVFRCNADPSAAMKWVMMLQKYEIASKNTTNSPPDFAVPPAEKSSFEKSSFEQSSFDEEKKGPDSAAQPEFSASRLAIRDLRAICHGAGINTVGMERPQLERAAAEVQNRGTYFAPPPSMNMPSAPASHRTASPVPPVPPAPGPPPDSNGSTTSHKISINDLRAICHGAGIKTVGMERGELEAAAEEVRKRGTYFAAPSSGASTNSDRTAEDAWFEEMKRKEDVASQQEELRKYEEMRRRQAEEEQRRREEDARRRQAEEEHRRRAEEDARRRAAEEEHRRRMAEEEHRRRVAEQQAADQRRRYAEQQAAWQRDEQKRRMAEQQAAEQRRRHEEALRHQQQWAGQPQGQQQQQSWTRHPPPPQGHQQWPGHQPHGHPGPHAPQWQQQQWQQHQQYQQQHQQGRPQAPPPQQHAPPPHQHPQQQSKYAKMANQTEDDGQAAITKIKHDILIQWALQPPQMQMLRSVDVLISTIQNVFPPALGVPAHPYFQKWKTVTRESVLTSVGIIDEERVKKAVRKLRFFLHPDKLPKDLNSEQQFMVKMLWDITNDAWEEYEKSKEDLDWIK